MDNITFLAKSSSGEDPYKVDFINDNGRLIVKCNCPAGRFGKFCKHKMRLIKGNYEILFDENQDDDLEEMQDIIQNSGYLSLIIDLSKAEKAVREAEEDLKKVKKDVALAMKSGV